MLIIVFLAALFGLGGALGWFNLKPPEGGGPGVLPYDSGVKGQVLLGPICPVMRDPPDPKCADQPYQTTVQIIRNLSPQSAPFATQETDVNGNYQFTIPPGQYSVQAVGKNPFPACSTQEIAIEPAMVKTLNLVCDTGIR